MSCAPEMGVGDGPAGDDDRLGRDELDRGHAVEIAVAHGGDPPVVRALPLLVEVAELLVEGYPPPDGVHELPVPDDRVDLGEVSGERELPLLRGGRLILSLVFHLLLLCSPPPAAPAPRRGRGGRRRSGVSPSSGRRAAAPSCGASCSSPRSPWRRGVCSCPSSC